MSDSNATQVPGPNQSNHRSGYQSKGAQTWNSNADATKQKAHLANNLRLR